jgi:ATP-dependent RNA helicase DDX35
VIQPHSELQKQGGPGDILVFLTGREEIDRCLSELSDLLPE